MSVTIRDYRADDAPRAWTLLEQGLAPYGLQADSCSTDRDLEDVERHYLARGGRFRMLEDDGRVIGMYGLYPVDSATVELRKMYLDPARKGRGLGKRMLEEALSLARAAGFTAMTLETNRALVEAIGLYLKYGFVDVPDAAPSTRCDRVMRLTL